MYSVCFVCVIKICNVERCRYGVRKLIKKPSGRARYRCFIENFYDKSAGSAVSGGFYRFLVPRKRLIFLLFG